jgi:hypothetical protein
MAIKKRSETRRGFWTRSNFLGRFLHDFAPSNNNKSTRNYSSFFSLPAEIRLIIYKHAFFAGAGGMLVAIDRDYFRWLNQDHTTPLRYIRSPRKSFPVALLQTNKQVYNEALPLMYREVTFFPSYNATILTHFLDTLSDFARSCIRHIRVSPTRLLNEPIRQEHEQLGWAVMCSEISRLPALCDVSILYQNIQILSNGPISLHQQRYARSLLLIPAKKLLEFVEREPYVCEEAEARFKEILAAKPE